MPRSLSNLLCLSVDDLGLIFTVLQEERIAQWDNFRIFGLAHGALCSCTLVSHSWRDIALRHLFRDLIFTHGPVVTWECVKLGHDPACPKCSCSCHSDEASPPRRELSAFYHHLLESPHIRQHAHSLRLLASPLGIAAGETMDVSLLFQVLSALPQLKALYLQDIEPPLPSSSTLPLTKILTLEHLTLAFRYRTNVSQRGVVDILAHCNRVRHLNLLGIRGRQERSRDAVNSPAEPFLEVDSIVLNDYEHVSPSIFTYLSKAVLGLRSFEVDRIKVPAVMRGLQTLINTTGARLELFAYGDTSARRQTYRGKLLLSIDGAQLIRLRISEILASLSELRAPDLSKCSGLESIDITLHLGCNSLGLYLEKIINPMLSSLRGGPRKQLQRITLKSSVLEGLPSHLEHVWVNSWLSELEDLLLQLREHHGLAEVLFILDDVAGREKLAAENKAAIHNSLPLLASLGILKVSTL